MEDGLGFIGNQAGVYPDFCSMKQLEVFILPPG